MLEKFGFEIVQRRRDGAVVWSRREHPWLVVWMTQRPNGMGEMTWELALGEYFVAKGYTFSAQDELSLFVFPSAEVTGMMDEAWVTATLDGLREQLSLIDLAGGT